MEKFPRVGVGVFVKKDNKILLGLRKGSHGSGEWSLPGGHLEFGESIEECAVREVMEETGMTIKNIKKVHFTNDIFEKEGKHYVTLFMSADWDNNEPALKEPERFGCWQWFDKDAFPSPLFFPIKNLIKENRL